MLLAIFYYLRSLDIHNNKVRNKSKKKKLILDVKTSQTSHNPF